MSAHPGMLLDHRFELRRQVDAGAMGVVYEAWDKEGERVVAVKVLRGEGARSTERFLREAAILAELDHPAIVRYVAQRISSDGERYIAMEWLEGQSLAERLRSRQLDVPEALILARRVALGLAAAHAKGVVHRDLKPSNLFLPVGQVAQAKILDFGIAWRAFEDVRLTETGTVLGTPLYMSPEQARGQSDLDERVDIYALGAVLFECITGRTPFGGASTTAILCKICLEEAPRLSTLLPSAPPELDALVARMLAKARNDRPESAAGLAQALEDIRSTAPPPTSRPPASGLSGVEQRVIGVILIGSRAMMTANEVDSLSVVVPPARRSSEPTDDIQKALAEHDARLDELLDGSMVITFPRAAPPTDQAAAMARCALLLRERMPEAPIAVCTGRGTVTGRVPVGEVVDRGVALLQTSKTGSIRLDSATASLLDARFEFEERGDDVYLKAEQERGETTRTVLGKPVPCVGRSAELTLLQGIFAQVVGESEARAVLVVAPAGAGKSRLRQELVDRLRRRHDDFEVILGRADSVRAGSPFGLLAASLRSAAGVSGEDPPDERREKLRARLSRDLPEAKVARVAEFLGELCGMASSQSPSPAMRSAHQDPRLMGDQLRAAWLDWLDSQCAARPTLLLLEDLHWSDAPSVQLIGTSLQTLRERPLMVLALARPEVHERFPRVWEEQGAQILPLTPLSRRACEKLATAISGDGVAPDVLDRIVTQAGGNPFFLEELLRGLATGQALLPDTIIGMLQHRLDALGTDTGRVLRAASVFGEKFHLQGVASLLGSDPELDVEAAVRTLVDGEVVSTHEGGGPHEYAFRHALVRDASYATLTEPDRVLGHRLAGEWLESVGEKDALVLAEHFDRGAALARAAHWYAKAAEQALQGDDLESATGRAERGIACGAVGETLAELTMIDAQARYWRGELARATESARRSIANVPVGGAAWFRAVGELVGIYIYCGENDELAVWARTALEATPLDTEAREAQVAGLSWTAGALAHDGQHALAEALLRHAETTLGGLKSPEVWTVLRFHYANAILLASRAMPVQAIDEFELALAAAEEAGDIRNACAIRVEIGTNWMELGEPERAHALVKRALADAKERSLALVEAFTLPALANIMIALGRLEEARAPLDEALVLATKSGSDWALGFIYFVGSALAYAKRDWAAAEREAQKAVTCSTRGPLPAAHSALARALLAQGRKAEALDASRRAMALLDEIGSTEFFESLVRLMNAETRMAAGDEEGARAAIRSAKSRLLERAEQFGAAEVRARFLSRVAENARTLELAKEWGESG